MIRLSITQRRRVQQARREDHDKNELDRRVRAQRRANQPANASRWRCSGTITKIAVSTFSNDAAKPHTQSCASYGFHDGGLPYSPLRSR